LATEVIEALRVVILADEIRTSAHKSGLCGGKDVDRGIVVADAALQEVVETTVGPRMNKRVRREPFNECGANPLEPRKGGPESNREEVNLASRPKDAPHPLRGQVRHER
jgi:hypothetical protein